MQGVLRFLRKWNTILTVLAAVSVSSPLAPAQPAPAWLNHAHDVQHTAVSSVAAQDFNAIHWSTPVDLHPPGGEILIHYGSPVITAANTVIVPVKTGSNSFRVDAHNGADGSLLWTEATGYSAPAAGFMPGFSPALSRNKLFIPAQGGVVMVRENPDSANGKTTALVFYGIGNLQANPRAYINNVQINTPITVDSAGTIYFGFIVLGSTPIGLQSGLAKITAAGQGSWVAASVAANDSSITKVAMSCAPALSPDGATLYVAVNSDFGFGYLLALNSTSLETITAARLKDPSSGEDADITDSSSATPTVGPDGDVYYGVLENPFPAHNDRGWMLHFNHDLTKVKIPGSFGWDDTASIVDASLVPSYHGTSTYLIMTKYNNYLGIGTGNGVNKIAILDPRATESDPIIPSTKVMNEVLTIKGVTPDGGVKGAVREWCINTAAVDSATGTVLANSEDGKLYRWDLSTNSFSQVIRLSGGIGEAYTPTLIGPDGTAYAINDAVLFAIGQ